MKKHVDRLKQLSIKHIQNDVIAFDLLPEKYMFEYFEMNLQQIAERR